MQEFRCHNCKSLLYKAGGDIDVELICQVCRCINYPNRVDSGLGLRGKDFQAKAIDHNCWKCQRLLFRSIGIGIIETKCRFCKMKSSFNTDDMRAGRETMKAPETEKDRKFRESIAR